MKGNAIAKSDESVVSAQELSSSAIETPIWHECISATDGVTAFHNDLFSDNMNL
jgi:hypothetical protein